MRTYLRMSCRTVNIASIDEFRIHYQIQAAVLLKEIYKKRIVFGTFFSLLLFFKIHLPILQYIGTWDYPQH